LTGTGAAFFGAGLTSSEDESSELLTFFVGFLVTATLEAVLA
jgi:hypothetical protein